MRSRGGFVLNLIGAILVLLIAVIAMIALAASREIAGMVGILGTTTMNLVWIFLVIHLVIGVLMILSAIWMNNDRKVKAGALMGLIVSIIGIVVGAGVFIGPVLGIIGSAIGLGKAARQPEKVIAKTRPRRRKRR
ncbi:MAG: hypothetical protein JSW08_01715 [archaeon]|nr:MAG: hypothetical protein JSW08_01715 [archaeon]